MARKINKDNLSQLGQILVNLMEEANIDDKALSKETGIPASTIARIRHKDSNPTLANVEPIAGFFRITIDQLLGKQPLPTERLPGEHKAQANVNAYLPVYNWHNLEKYGHLSEKEVEKHIPTSKPYSNDAFVLQIPVSSLGLLFQKGSYVIIDPEQGIDDSDYVIVRSARTGKLTIKKLLLDGDMAYLKSVIPGINSTTGLTGEHQIYGAIQETKNIIKDSDSSHSQEQKAGENKVPGLLSGLIKKAFH